MRQIVWAAPLVFLSFALPIEARELHLVSGVIRQVDACEEAGVLIRYRIGDAWYVIQKAQVRRIEPPCDQASGPAAKVQPAPTGSASVSTTESSAPLASAPVQGDQKQEGTTAEQAASSGPSSSSTSPGKSVDVQGYTRKDGTYVPPHTRSAPGSGRRR
jgi:hypothetical protein